MASADELNDFSHLDITAYIKDIPLRSSAAGGFSDVFKCTLRGQAVAVKVFCTHRIDRDPLVRSINREIGPWSEFEHPNILKLEGVCFLDNSLLPSLVTRWMENGTLKDFLRDNHEIDICHYVYDVSEALTYVHSKDIVHGDVKGCNILVSDNGTAVLADFGLSRSAIDGFNTLTSMNPQGSVRWMPREYFRTDQSNSMAYPRRTKACDVWSLGMTILELWSGEHPFMDIRENAHVSIALTRGELPTFPPCNRHESAFHETSFRELCNQCWTSDPNKRPNMSLISLCLRAMSESRRAGRRLIMAAQKASGLVHGTSSVSDRLTPPPEPVRGPVKEESAVNEVPSHAANEMHHSQPQPQHNNSSRNSAVDDDHTVICHTRSPLIDGHPAQKFSPSLENYRAKLQVYLQTKGSSDAVQYSASSKGPPHDPIWTSICYIDGQDHGHGVGKTKKEANEESAREALMTLYQSRSIPSRKRHLHAYGLDGKVEWQSQATISGPAYIPLWTSIVFLDGRELGHGAGGSKEEAEEEAAKVSELILGYERQAL